MLFYTAVISFIIVYIQSIGSGMDVYSGLFNNSSVLVLFSSLIPLKPTKLTQAELDSFLLSKDFKPAPVAPSSAWGVFHMINF